MRALLLLFFLLLITSIVFAQNVTDHPVEPKGVYKEINLSNDIRVIQLLLDTNANSSNSLLIDSVKRNVNNHTPPVFYALSNILFYQKKYNEACYWFYLAQLRARYDVNRCTDKTANASQYNMNFGMPINEYAFRHLDTLKVIVKKVVDFVRQNEELYDQRWINLTGMDAMTASMSDKPVNKKLSIDKSEWPAVKTKTIDEYYHDFEVATNRDLPVDKDKLLGRDYRLFQNTPAWELAKAVQDEDTTKIKNEIIKNISLIAFREPRFGQTMLALAVINTNYNSVKTLLELGADPNMQDTYNGSSPLMEAAKLNFFGDHYGSDPRYLKLLLAHGGDPNSPEKGEKRSSGHTPLMMACRSGDLNYVKILVEAGANINTLTQYGGSALYNAANSVFASAPDIVIYLIDNGADFKRPLAIFQKHELYLSDALRMWRFDLESDEYKKKMQIVDLLKKNGIDYRKTKIPEQFLDDYPKEYLEKY